MNIHTSGTKDGVTVDWQAIRPCSRQSALSGPCGGERPAFLQATSVLESVQFGASAMFWHPLLWPAPGSRWRPHARNDRRQVAHLPPVHHYPRPAAVDTPLPDGRTICGCARIGRLPGCARAVRKLRRTSSYTGLYQETWNGMSPQRTELSVNPLSKDSIVRIRQARLTFVW